MAEKLRPHRETKEIGLKRLKECYEKMNSTTCPPEKMREFEHLYHDHILPRVYDKDKK